MAAMRRLVLASQNPHKVRELAASLAAAGVALDVVAVSDVGPPPTIAEDHDTFVAHAAIKARAISAWLHDRGEPGETIVLADDSGVSVAALDGAPGVDSAVFAGPDADDAANNAHLVAALATHGATASPAHYTCVLALRRVDGKPWPVAPGVTYVATPDVVFIVGRWDGEIRQARGGDGGFGYDPHFWLHGPAGWQTAAELSPAEKSARSHRGQAVRALVAALPQLLA